MSENKPSIPFIDLQAQRRRLDGRLEAAFAAMLNHGQFIMGPEVAELERRLSAFCGARHTLGVSNGTDALLIALMALDVRLGDAVFVPAFTFVATAEAPAMLGAVPFFVDVTPDHFTMDPASLEEAIATAHAQGLVPKVVIPVGLFGQSADYDALMPIARAHGLRVVDDAAQSFGAVWRGSPVGTLGDITATSFFPAKPLGCYGDGGAVFTDDDDLSARMRSVRNHGEGKDRYDNVRIGMNGRLDTIQAAILLEKLAIFPDEIIARHAVAERYRVGLEGVADVPRLASGATSVWAQYTIQIEERDRVAATLREAGVPTAVYYPIPLSRQKGYNHYPANPGGTPVADALSRRVLSLPMHPYLEPDVQDRIIESVISALG